jgi:hypothetical protein
MTGPTARASGQGVLLPRAFTVAAVLAGLVGLCGSMGAATSLQQPGFSETAVFTGLVNPTVVRFLPDGRVLVAEKSGLIKLFPNLTTNTYTVVADLRQEVHNFWDRGLLGMAVDPNFATNNYIYVLYAYDAPIGGTPPRWGPGDGTSDGCPSPPGATTDGCVISGRLSRLTATGPSWTSSEFPLINDWCQQFPSHSVGSLVFGADGYLYVSGGEGASFGNDDWGQFGGSSGSPTPKNPCGDPPAGVGGNETVPTADPCAPRARGGRPANRACSMAPYCASIRSRATVCPAIRCSARQTSTRNASSRMACATPSASRSGPGRTRCGSRTSASAAMRRSTAFRT